MQHSPDPISQLRLLLHSPPSPSLWSELSALFHALQTQHPHLLHVAREYTQSLLAGWPTHLRRAISGQPFTQDLVPLHLWELPKHPSHPLFALATFHQNVIDNHDLKTVLNAPPTHLNLPTNPVAHHILWNTLPLYDNKVACFQQLSQHTTLRELGISTPELDTYLTENLARVSFASPMEGLCLCANNRENLPPYLQDQTNPNDVQPLEHLTYNDAWSSLRALLIDSAATPTTLENILDSAWDLQHLTLRNSPLGSDAFLRISTHERAHSLHHLSLAGSLRNPPNTISNSPTPDLLESIQNPNYALRSLRSLNLSNNALSTRDVSLLSMTRVWKHLEHLDLSNALHTLHAPHSHPFMRANTFRSLRSLNLLHNTLSTHTLRVLSKQPFIHQLEHLHIGQNADLKPSREHRTHLTALAESISNNPHNMRSLALIGVLFESIAARLFSPNLIASLQHLDLSQTVWSPTDIKAFTQNITHITSLFLHRCTFPRRSLPDLFEAGHLPNLRHIRIQLHRTALRTLKRASFLPKLRILDLCGSYLDGLQLSQFLLDTDLQSLHTLNLTHTPLNTHDIHTLIPKLPTHLKRIVFNHTTLPHDLHTHLKHHLPHAQLIDQTSPKHTERTLAQLHWNLPLHDLLPSYSP